MICLNLIVKDAKCMEPLSHLFLITSIKIYEENASIYEQIRCCSVYTETEVTYADCAFFRTHSYICMRADLYLQNTPLQDLQ